MVRIGIVALNSFVATGNRNSHPIFTWIGRPTEWSVDRPDEESPDPWERRYRLGRERLLLDDEAKDVLLGAFRGRVQFDRDSGPPPEGSINGARP